MVEVIRLPRRMGATAKPQADIRLPLSNVIERVAMIGKLAHKVKTVEDKMDLERALGRLEDELRRRGVDPTG
jgi:hypothetical protein